MLGIASTMELMSWPIYRQTLETFFSETQSTELVFEQIAFHEPFLIVYSSGTTGMPKCIVHSAGVRTTRVCSYHSQWGINDPQGVILSSKKEGRLHGELGPHSVTLQYTTVRDGRLLSMPTSDTKHRQAGSCT